MRFTNPPPFNEDDFESLCLAVFRRALAANDLARYGRRGQRQDGIDLLGHSVGSYRLLAVQCKLRNKNHALTKKQLRDEVSRVRSWKQATELKTYVLATTAPRDTKLQDLAAQLTSEHLERGLFDVQVWGWEDFEDFFVANDDIRDQFYCGIGSRRASQILERTDEIAQSIRVPSQPPAPAPVHFVHTLLSARDWQDRPELLRLTEWWRHDGTGVVALVGIGGAGKTAIVERLIQMNGVST